MLTNIMKWISISALFLAVTFWRSAANYQLLLDFVVFMGAVVVVMQAVRAREYRWAAGLWRLPCCSTRWYVFGAPLAFYPS